MRHFSFTAFFIVLSIGSVLGVFITLVFGSLITSFTDYIDGLTATNVSFAIGYASAAAMYVSDKEKDFELNLKRQKEEEELRKSIKKSKVN